MGRVIVGKRCELMDGLKQLINPGGGYSLRSVELVFGILKNINIMYNDDVLRKYSDSASRLGRIYTDANKNIMQN